MSVILNIKLKKVDKVYHEGENVTGVISINTASDLKHDGITLSMEGYVNLQLSSKNVGILEAFYNSVKPIQLVSLTCEVSGPGRIPSGCTEIPFELPLQPRTNRELYETYHGVFINISYSLKCDVKRSFLSKDLQKTQQFLVQYRPKVPDPPRSISFTISPASLASGGAGAPNFLIRGKFDSTRCSVSSPLTGYLVFEHCALPIKSVELQLVRVETCGCAEGYARDALKNCYPTVCSFSSKNHGPILLTRLRILNVVTHKRINFRSGTGPNGAILKRFRKARWVETTERPGRGKSRPL